MTELLNIKRNSFYSFISITSRLVANVFIFWLMARFYGEEVFGEFTFVHTLATTFLLFADFGFDVLLTTSIARYRDQAVTLFSRYFSIKLIFSLIAFSAMLLVVIYQNIDATTGKLIFVFSIFMLFTTLTNFLLALFRGFELLILESKVAIAMNVFLLIFGGTLIILRVNVLYVGIAFAFARLGGFLFSFVLSKKLKTRLTYNVDFSDFVNSFKKTAVFGLLMLFSNSLYQVDTLLLGFLGDSYQVGVYQAVSKFILLPLVIPQILMNSLIPTLSRFNETDIDKWKKTGFMFNKVLLGVVAPISVILYLHADFIITLVYGKGNFVDSVVILRIFAFILFTRFCFEALGVSLTTSNRQRTQMIILFFANIISISLNLHFIPLYGPAGAAIISLVSSFFVFVLFGVVNKSLFKEWFLDIRVILLFVVFGTSILVLSNLNGLNVFISVSSVLLVFIAYEYFFFFSREEKLLLFPTATFLKN